MICKHCGSEIAEQKLVSFPELGIEVDFEQKQNNALFKDLIIPKGWRLLELKELEPVMNYITKYKLNIWSYFKQPIKSFEGKFVARFWADSDRAFLDCGWDSDCGDDSLGVILCKNLKAKVKRCK